MGIDSGTDGRSWTERSIEDVLTKKKLHGHAANIIQAVYTTARENFDEMFPTGDPKRLLMHYEEHARKTFKPQEADLYMQLSDPGAVAAFDAIIDEVRANFDAIKGKGQAAVEGYCERLRALLDQRR